MGTRLTKKLGWALTDLQCDEQGYITDPRVNADAVGGGTDEFGSRYLEYLKALRDAEAENSDPWFDLMMTIGMVEEAVKTDGHLPWPVVRPFEGGLRNVLLVQPVGYNWSRHNDPIDVAEENVLHPDTLGGRIVPMEYGIYPFEGLYMDSRTGRRLDSTVKRLIDRLTTVWTEENADRFRSAAEHLAKAIGFESADDALEHIAPIVPPDVHYVISWLDLFTGPDVWLRLRPVLYAYWS